MKNPKDWVIALSIVSVLFIALSAWLFDSLMQSRSNERALSKQMYQVIKHPK